MAAAAILAVLLTVTFFLTFFLARFVSWIKLQRRLERRDLKDTIATLTLVDSMGDRERASEYIDVLIGKVCEQGKAFVAVFAVVKNLVQMLRNVYFVRYSLNKTHPTLVIETVPVHFRRLLMKLLINASEGVIRAGYDLVTVFVNSWGLTITNKATSQDRRAVAYRNSKRLESFTQGVSKLNTFELCDLLGWDLHYTVDEEDVTAVVVWKKVDSSQ